MDKNYPKNRRKEITELDISEKNLQETLDLSNFVNLEELNCSENQLTSLNLDNCSKLKKLDCSDNQLTELDLSNCNQLYDINCSENGIEDIKFPYRTEQLTRLIIGCNNFSNQDLSFLNHLVNLKYLYLADNNFEGSLEFLKNMNKLEDLDISRTDIDSGLEYLSDSVKDFYCFVALDGEVITENEYGCKVIHDLLVREGELNIYKPIKNFPQKLKEYKQKIAKEKARELLKDEFQGKEQTIQELKEKTKN